MSGSKRVPKERKTSTPKLESRIVDDGPNPDPWWRTEPRWWVKDIVLAALLVGVGIYLSNILDNDRSEREQAIQQEAEHSARVTADLGYVRAALMGGSKYKAFSGLDLQGQNLSHMPLRYADLRQADLRHANMVWTDLRGSTLAGADLRGADLTSAFLDHADLRNADLRDAIMVIDPDGRRFLSGSGDTFLLANTSVRGICYNSETRFPENFRPPESRVDCRYYTDAPFGLLPSDRRR
jgi:hypothetical protein